MSQKKCDGFDKKYNNQIKKINLALKKSTKMNQQLSYLEEFFEDIHIQQYLTNQKINHISNNRNI